VTAHLRPGSPPSDADAVDAVDRLYRTRREQLMGFVIRLAFRYRLPAPYQAAEDIVQATFAEALQHWSQLRQPEAWLYVVARRLTIVESSQTARFGLAVDDSALEQASVGGWTSAARRPSAEDIVAAREVVDAMTRLGGRKKIVTYLRHVQGWDPAEIADFLGCARSTVNVHAHRGVAALAATLGMGLLTAVGWAVAAIDHLLHPSRLLSRSQRAWGMVILALMILYISFNPGEAADFISRVANLSASIVSQVGFSVTTK
jgi:RNA polymerase sigma factor (sigma-70 family)